MKYQVQPVLAAASSDLHVNLYSQCRPRARLRESTPQNCSTPGGDHRGCFPQNGGPLKMDTVVHSALRMLRHQDAAPTAPETQVVEAPSGIILFGLLRGPFLFSATQFSLCHLGWLSRELKGRRERDPKLSAKSPSGPFGFPLDMFRSQHVLSFPITTCLFIRLVIEREKIGEDGNQGHVVNEESPHQD